mgnify:FL=1
MKKLYGLFAEYTNSFGQQLFVHKYKYCTAREIIKEKRILEETLLEMTLNNDENNLYIWFEDILDSHSLKKEKICVKRIDNKQ